MINLDPQKIVYLNYFYNVSKLKKETEHIYLNYSKGKFDKKHHFLFDKHFFQCSSLKINFYLKFLLTKHTTEFSLFQFIYYFEDTIRSNLLYLI